MSYMITLGMADIWQNERGGFEVKIYGRDGLPEVHSDPQEVTPGSSSRSPPYAAWGETLDACPAFRRLWQAMHQWRIDRPDGELDIVPLALVADDLDAVEHEALTKPDEIANRVLWFVRWARYFLTEHDGPERAAVEIIG